jgi:glutathionylspermidine synthase
MKRISIRPRHNFEARAQETGFDFHATDGAVYWDESACYAFTLEQIEEHLEAPSQELAALCLDLVGRVAGDERLLTRLAIPPHAWDLIAQSWRRSDPSLYGRFDFSYDGERPAKLLEYNADTPTALFEASVFQWLWLEDAMAQSLIPSGSDQFNSIHEVLIARLRELRQSCPRPPRLHLSCMRDSSEDRGLIAYLEDCAIQAGFATTVLPIDQIGDDGAGPFLDMKDAPIELLFKLYPWEWMFADPFSRSAAMSVTRFIEPPWKAILSNKGMLPLLWEREPGHPNLLPSYFADDPARRTLTRYARKPFYSREGANVLLVDGDDVIDRDDGPYGREGFIFQELATPPSFDGNFPVVGSWIIGTTACGIGIREDASPITKNTSRFLPHIILPQGCADI